MDEREATASRILVLVNRSSPHPPSDIPPKLAWELRRLKGKNAPGLKETDSSELPLKRKSKWRK